MKIGLLFKSEVGLINMDYAAGAERMFLQDVEILEKAKIPYKAFCANKFIKDKKFVGNVKTIYYPRFIKKIINLIKRILPLRIIYVFSNFSLVILEFIYCLLFLFRCRECNIFYTYQVSVLAIIFPQKTIITFHNFTTIPLFHLFKKRYLKAKFSFCSEFLQQQFFQTYKELKKAKHKVIYNAVDLKKFYPSNKIKRENKRLNFLYVSSWRKEKGIYLLLKSIKILEDEGINNFKVFIAGSADLWYSDRIGENFLIQKKVRKLASNIKGLIFIGRVKYYQLRKYYQNSDWLIFPSIWEEPSALTLIESLMCGTPVVGFNVGGNTEILNNKVAFILKQNTAKMLANTLKKIITYKKSLKVNKNEYLKITKKFSIARRQKQLLDFINDK